MDMLRFLPVLTLCLMACHAVPVIVVPPSESTVRVRGSVTLTCKIMNKGMYEVSWLKSGRVISNDEAIVSSAVASSRYSIVGEPSQGNYSLKITEVITSDHDMFKCQLRAPPSGGTNVESLPVTLVVQFPPADGYPTCFPQYNEIRGLSIGSKLLFGCSTELGEPAAQLQWTQNGTELESYVDRGTTGFISMLFYRNITVEDHNEKFLCTLTQDLLSDGPRTCEVGPLDVLFPPMEAKIEPRQTYSPKVGSPFLLSCNAKANPTVLDFRWYTIPPIDVSREQSAVGMVWVLSKLEAEDDGTVVICEARNNMGALNTTYTISVTRETTPPPPTTAPRQPTTVRITPPKSTLASTNPFSTPYVIILILIAIALLMLAITLVIIAMKRKKRPAAVITVTDLDNLHADVHSLASFGNISRHGTPYLDRVDYELNRGRSHSRDHMFDTDSLDSASALMMRGISSDSPTHRKYSVDSLGKPHGHTHHRDHYSRRPSNGSPVHQAAKRLDSSPVKDRKQSDSALSQAGRPLPKIGPVVEQNEYAELTPVSARKKYGDLSQNSVASPESGYCEDEVLLKNVDNSYTLQSSNNCNCSRKMSHVEV